MKPLSSDKIKPYILSAFDEIKPSIEDKKDNEIIDEKFKKAYEEAFNKGYQEGFVKGEKKGYEEGLKKAEAESQVLLKQKLDEISRVVETLNRIGKELGEFKEQQLKGFLPQILKLAFKIAEKIVSTHITLDRAVVLSIVNEVLKSIPANEEKVIVKLNPEDYDFINRHLEMLQIDKTKIQLESSQNLKPGDCYIETSSQYIDATVNQKIKELEDAVSSILT